MRGFVHDRQLLFNPQISNFVITNRNRRAYVLSISVYVTWLLPSAKSVSLESFAESTGIFTNNFIKGIIMSYVSIRSFLVAALPCITMGMIHQTTIRPGQAPIAIGNELSSGTPVKVPCVGVSKGPQFTLDRFCRCLKDQINLICL